LKMHKESATKGSFKMTRVLLLNASYEPLNVITWRRAISLILRERVDPATDEAVMIQGLGQGLKIPTVVRLRRYINVPRRGARWSRKMVLQRDGYRCIYCHTRPGEARHGRLMQHQDFTIDHILPVSRGGKSTWTNTACACIHCNQRKGNRLPHEAGMDLLWEPKTPRVDYLVAGGDVPAAWRIYLQVVTTQHPSP
jgi:5-methylcytosine-specific restriction endonuclease McrA